MSSIPHESFLRDLYALCQNHGVHLDGTEEDGVLVVPNDVDMDLEDDDGQLHPERFAYVICDGDGAMRCRHARATITGGLEPHYGEPPLDLPSVK